MNRFIKIVLIVILLISTLSGCDIVIYEPKPTNILSVHYLDVGQGDSIFVELPDARTMLIDSGENYNGEGIIKYINDCGYSKIDYLIATHPHSDHIGSMSYIVRHMDIGTVYMPNVSTTTNTYKNLLESISDRGLTIKSASAGINVIEQENLSVDILAPVTIDEDDLNNCSVVMKITYKNRSFLFTGDAEETELEEVYMDMTADVLKVGHHGSKASTTEDIIERISPEIAVISLGKNNDYGHPHKSTMKILKDYECEIYRTDKDKTINISTDGNILNVETKLSSIERAK